MLEGSLLKFLKFYLNLAQRAVSDDKCLGIGDDSVVKRDRSILESTPEAQGTSKRLPKSPNDREGQPSKAYHEKSYQRQRCF